MHDNLLTAKYTIDLEAQDHKVHCNKLFNIGEISLHLEYYLERFDYFFLFLSPFSVFFIFSIYDFICLNLKYEDKLSMEMLFMFQS